MAACRGVHRQKLQRIDIDHPHRERIFFEQQTERGFAALQVGDVDADADTATVRGAAFLDPDPAVPGQLLFVRALGLRVAGETFAQPLFFAALGVGILSAR